MIAIECPVLVRRNGRTGSVAPVRKLDLPTFDKPSMLAGHDEATSDGFGDFFTAHSHRATSALLWNLSLATRSC